MRRLMFAIASVAVFAFVPASALGRAGSQHHKRHHRHHAHIRRFGDVTSPGSPTTVQVTAAATTADLGTAAITAARAQATTTTAIRTTARQPI
jgi:hypothetical protein